MTYKILLSRRANYEIIQSIDWYNSQKKGLGKRFYSNISDNIRIVKKNPFAFACRYKNFRCVPLNVFPFILVYFIDEHNIIVISAVFHTSRNPEETFEKH